MSVPEEVGVGVFGLHTILFVFGGVVLDIGAFFLCFHTFFFSGGARTTFEFFSFSSYSSLFLGAAFFFCFGFS